MSYIKEFLLGAVVGFVVVAFVVPAASGKGRIWTGMRAPLKKSNINSQWEKNPLEIAQPVSGLE